MRDPASPLPWKAQQDDFGDGDGLQWVIGGVRHMVAIVYGSPFVADQPTEGAEASDAAYIVHAANAYPGLIEELNRATEVILAGVGTHGEGCDASPECQFIRDATDWLRKRKAAEA